MFNVLRPYVVDFPFRFISYVETQMQDVRIFSLFCENLRSFVVECYKIIKIIMRVALEMDQKPVSVSTFILNPLSTVTISERLNVLNSCICWVNNCLGKNPQPISFSSFWEALVLLNYAWILIFGLPPLNVSLRSYVIDNIYQKNTCSTEARGQNTWTSRRI